MSATKSWVDTAEAYAPYAVFRRAGGSAKIEIVGTILRPWLEGVTPEWELD